MLIKRNFVHLFSASFFLLFFTCCGGGGGDTPAIVSNTPTSPWVQTTSCGTDCMAGAPIDRGNGIWEARDASCECINAAIQSSQSGDTIYVPAGDYNWGSDYLTISKAVKLIGAGTSDTAGTRISGTSSTAGFGLIDIRTGQDGSFPLVISGFRFKSNDASSGSPIIRMIGAGQGWRIHGNIFHRPEPNAIIQIVSIASGGSHRLFGLLDDNVFENVKIYVQGSTSPSNNSAESSWRTAAQWGTDQAVFIENNIFIAPRPYNGSRIDSNGGSRLVIRYNDFLDARIEAHSACEPTIRGARSYEIYNNRFMSTDASGGWATALALRAGSHVITRNVVAGVYYETGRVALDNRRSFFDSACSSGFGDADGTSEYDTYNADPPHPGTPGAMNLIPLDGIGVGTGAIGSQTLDPVYIWNNTSDRICIGGTNKYDSCSSDSDCPSSTCSTQVNTPNYVYRRNDSNYAPYQIVANRNYFENTARPGWSPHRCPHSLAGNGFCSTSVAGRGGYNLY